MYCDYLILLFLGFATKDSEYESSDDVGNNISNVLKEVSKYCKGSYYRPPFLPPSPVTESPNFLDMDYHNYQDADSIFKDYTRPIGYSDYPYKVNDYIKEHRVPNHRVPYLHDSDSITPSRRMQILQQQYGEMPIVTSTNDLVNIVNNNQANMVRIPESIVMKLMPRDQLSVLYDRNEAFDLPSSDPSMPRLIAMTTRVLSSILKAKKRFHNVIDHGVEGAENVFSGIHEAAGGIAELIGGGAHGLLDFIV